MARPAGQFNKNRDRCYQILCQIAQLGECMVGTAYLSKSLGVCEKQVQRYLASLKKEGRIGIETRNAQPGDGNWYRKRKITILKHFSQRTASEDPLAAVTTKLAEEAQQRAASYQELNSYYRA